MVRIRFIKSAQKLGFSLDDVAGLLKLEDGTHCAEASALATHKLEDIRHKIAVLKSMESALSGLLVACHETSPGVSCPLIVSLQHAESTEAQR